MKYPPRIIQLDNGAQIVPDFLELLMPVDNAYQLFFCNRQYPLQMELTENDIKNIRNSLNHGCDVE